MSSKDQKYLDIITECLRTSALYKPKFGQPGKSGLTLTDFQDLYRGDHFYNWFGLDEPAIYSAHKAAGGITSMYRQIGTGCERVFRRVLRDNLLLSEDDVRWSYEEKLDDGKTRKLSLDARIPIDSVKDDEKRTRVHEWIKAAARKIDMHDNLVSAMTGAVFEVRQGYKSKDSKRQNADINNATVAIRRAYLPCVVVLSNQIDSDVLTRYRSSNLTVLTGLPHARDSTLSTYAFMREAVGYDLEAFFERNSEALRNAIRQVVDALLSTE